MEGTGIPSDLLISKVLHAHRLDLEVVHFEWTDLMVDGQWCRKSGILSINSKIISFDRIIYDEGVPCCVLSKLQVSPKIPQWTWLTGPLTKMPTVAVVEPELDWNNYQLKSSYQKCMWCFLYYLLLYSIQLYVIYIYTSFTLPSQSLPTYISHYRTNLRPVTTQVAPPGRTGEALATVGVGDAQDGCGWRGGKIHWKFHVFWKPSNRKGQILFILYMYFLLGNK